GGAPRSAAGRDRGPPAGDGGGEPDHGRGLQRLEGGVRGDPGLEAEARDHGAQSQAGDVGPAEEPVVAETDAVVPERPARVPGRRTFGTRTAHDLQGPDGAREGDGGEGE